jgi:hypothetical protein
VEKQMKKLTAEQLDKQSIVHLSGWKELNSKDHKLTDEDYETTSWFLNIGFEDGYLFLDDLNRVWGYNREKEYYFPFHYECCGKLYGIKLKIDKTEPVKVLN